MAETISAADEQEPVSDLAGFIKRVSDIRKYWGLPPEKELWFRGESKDYGATILHPELFRPAVNAALKPMDRPGY